MKLKLRILFVSSAIVILAALPAAAQSSAKKVKCVPHVPSKGDVLVTGGEDLAENQSANTEFFHAATGQWMTGCPTSVQHDESQIAVFGSQIIVVSGETLPVDSKGDHLITKATDIYSATTGKFRKGPAVKTPREDFAAVALKDGSILVVGGVTNTDSETPVNTGEIFKQSFKAIKQKMTTGRAGPAAALMTSGAKAGQVLIAAGTDTSENTPQLATAELYDPTKGTFTATKGNLVAARSFAIATALPDGTVLITGGIDNSFKALASAEIYNPTTDSFSQTIGNMNAARVDHSATLLPDGTVLVAGGENTGGKLNSAEIYNPTTQMFTATATMNDFRDDNTATLISGSGTALDGQVLIEGGFFNSHSESTAEIYNPTAKTFTATSAMNFAHGEASAALIP